MLDAIRVIEEVAYIRLRNTNERAKLSVVSVPWVQGKDWFRSRFGYPVTRMGEVFVPMHSLVLEAKEGFVIDHINRDPMDNRLENLRWATSSQNAANRGPRSKSGFKGVVLKGAKYEASIKSWKRNVYLGRYDTAEEAARAYDYYALLMYGEFAYLNYPDEVPTEPSYKVIRWG